MNIYLKLISDLNPQESFQHRSELWIVMEYCSGGSVADLIAVSGEPLREDVIAYICGEALKVRGSPMPLWCPSDTKIFEDLCISSSFSRDS